MAAACYIEYDGIHRWNSRASRDLVAEETIHVEFWEFVSITANQVIEEHSKEVEKMNKKDWIKKKQFLYGNTVEILSKANWISNIWSTDNFIRLILENGLYRLNFEYILLILCMIL